MILLFTGLLIGGYTGVILYVVSQHRQERETKEEILEELSENLEKKHRKREVDRPLKLEEELDRHVKRELQSDYVGVSADDIMLQQITLDGESCVVDFEVDK